MKLREPLAGEAPSTDFGKHHWLTTVALLISAICGAAVLALPAALKDTGWIGVGILLFCALLANYTALLLSWTVEIVNRPIKAYADLGEIAFGKVGRIITALSVYISLGGIIVVYLVLIGNLMHALVPLAPRGFWTLVGAAMVLPGVLFIKSVNDLSWTGYVTTAITLLVMFVAIGLSAGFYASSARSKHGDATRLFSTEVISPNWGAVTIGFGVFTFALGAHPLFPSLVVQMKNREHWSRAVHLSWIVVLLLYCSISIIGYLAYGQALNGPSLRDETVLETITKYSGEFSSSTEVLLPIAESLLVAQLAFLLPIYSVPFFLAVEETVLSWRKRRTSPESARLINISDGDGDSLPTAFQTLLIRGIGFVAMALVALFLPYFLNMISLVSALTMSLAVYILPALFYWRLSPIRPHWFEMFCLTICIILGVLGSIIGTYWAALDLIEAVAQGGNPFRGLFTFGAT